MCGVEAHACVQATALDFLHRGFRVGKKSFFSLRALDQKYVVSEISLTRDNGLYI